MSEIVKTFNFRNGVSGKFNVKKLLTIYHNTDKLNPQFLCLLYLSSERFRTFVQENLPDYFSRLNIEDEEYEQEVFYATNALSYDISQQAYEGAEPIVSNFTENTVEQNLLDFLDIEMTMWIKWAYNKHVETNTPVHLIRHLVGTSII